MKAGSHGQRFSDRGPLHAQSFNVGLLDQFEGSTLPRFLEKIPSFCVSTIDPRTTVRKSLAAATFLSAPAGGLTKNAACKRRSAELLLSEKNYSAVRLWF